MFFTDPRKKRKQLSGIAAVGNITKKTLKKILGFDMFFGIVEFQFKNL